MQSLPSAVPFPFGVASSDGRLAFMRAPQGAVRALALADGNELWTSADGGIPLFADANGLITAVPATDRRNAVRLVLLDLQTGARKFQSDPIVLPEWALVTGANDVEVRFRAAPANGLIVLDWCARSWYGGGANPNPKIEREASKKDSGRFRIDAADGRATAAQPVDADLLCGDRPPAQVSGAPPEALASSRIGDRVYYLVALAPTQRTATRARLIAADAASGTVHWQREVAVPSQVKRLPLEIRKGGY